MQQKSTTFWVFYGISAQNLYDVLAAQRKPQIANLDSGTSETGH
jgi:hypothetical protein